eukprot:CAMPEP_0196158560 /NCGR_PEP_ID=MMETSP0910-20130528/45875_1 /TAXON_ID=49265 /ORGANISM="Thalassiosira rotula, Strain GSO102" /LENGTH=324 /DNA_ID=CAMNT_0041423463 /DNA_START=117 /DNA_END=1091 /DNA_ORIENTATION=-
MKTSILISLFTLVLGTPDISSSPQLRDNNNDALPSSSQNKNAHNDQTSSPKPQNNQIDHRELYETWTIDLGHEPCATGLDAVECHTDRPTDSPTLSPSISPSISPTLEPTRKPIAKPTLRPTDSPTLSPSISPTLFPSLEPTRKPITKPTLRPTDSPTLSPSISPTLFPTLRSTDSPTLSPSLSPSITPTLFPTTSQPSPSWNGGGSIDRSYESAWSSSWSSSTSKSGKSGSKSGKSGGSSGGSKSSKNSKSGKSSGSKSTQSRDYDRSNVEGANSGGLSKVSNMIQYSEFANGATVTVATVAIDSFVYRAGALVFAFVYLLQL